MIAKPAATADDLRHEHAQHGGAERREQQRPEPVEQRQAGPQLGQRHLHPRVRQQPRDRRRGRVAAAEPGADQRRREPPADADLDQRRLDLVAHAHDRQRGEQRRASPR